MGFILDDPRIFQTIGELFKKFLISFFECFIIDVDGLLWDIFIEIYTVFDNCLVF